jgi:hypothetical protein
LVLGHPWLTADDPFDSLGSYDTADDPFDSLRSLRASDDEDEYASRR